MDRQRNEAKLCPPNYRLQWRDEFAIASTLKVSLQYFALLDFIAAGVATKSTRQIVEYFQK